MNSEVPKSITIVFVVVVAGLQWWLLAERRFPIFSIDRLRDLCAVSSVLSAMSLSRFRVCWHLVRVLLRDTDNGYWLGIMIMAINIFLSSTARNSLRARVPHRRLGRSDIRHLFGQRSTGLVLF